jgi:hypothetical protein
MIVLENASAYGISICSARRLTEEEKAPYRDECKDSIFVGLSDSIQLPEITWRDIPSWRERDASTLGFFLGCGNSAFVISEEEKAHFLALNAERIAKKQAAKDAAKAAKQAKIDAAFAAAKSSNQPQELNRWMTEGCSANLEDCSFDSAVELAMPDGTTKIRYSHCY